MYSVPFTGALTEQSGVVAGKVLQSCSSIDFELETKTIDNLPASHDVRETNEAPALRKET